MKYRHLHKWGEYKNNKNLVFFAQIMEELLFDFSLDTYKPSAMNSSLLCKEALETFDEIDKGNIAAPNLQHVLDEFCDNLDKDIVSKLLLEIDLDEIKAVLKDRGNGKKRIITSHDKKILLELLQKQLTINKYKKKTEELLISVISSEENLKDVRALARNYVTTLKNIGYSHEYIKQKFFKYFYNLKESNTNKNIEIFLSIFDGIKKTYITVCKGTDLFEDIIIADKAKNNMILDVIVQKQLNKEYENISDFNIENNEKYIYVKDIKAMDHISAKNISENYLKRISSIFSLFHHKKNLTFSKKCIVEDSKNNCSYRINQSINVMHKCVDSRLKPAAKKFAKIISEVKFSKESLQKFLRSSELHSLALNSESNENKIINLWIALESLIPFTKDKEISNIENIIEHIMPCLCIIYYPRLYFRFYSDLFIWNKGFMKNLIKDIDGQDSYEKVLKIISLSRYEKKREEIKNKFGDYYLMKDRFEFFSHLFSNSENLKKGIENHKKRLEWQIRRIYRARNLIVHSGITPDYVEILITNLHDYLDIIFQTLIMLVIEPNKIDSIEQGFKYTQLSYSEFIKSLSKKRNFDEEWITMFSNLNNIYHDSKKMLQ